MPLHKTIEEWKRVKADAVFGGSSAQALNVLTMAFEDIQKLGTELQRYSNGLGLIRKIAADFREEKLKL